MPTRIKDVDELDLTKTAAWVGDIVPVASDIAAWRGSGDASGAASLGGTQINGLTVAGIQYGGSGTTSDLKIPGAVSLGSSGIAFNYNGKVPTRALILSGTVTATAAQRWDLSPATGTTYGLSVTKLSGSAAVTVANGTLQMGGSASDYTGTMTLETGAVINAGNNTDLGINAKVSVVGADVSIQNKTTANCTWRTPLQLSRSLTCNPDVYGWAVKMTLAGQVELIAGDITISSPNLGGSNAAVYLTKGISGAGNLRVKGASSAYTYGYQDVGLQAPATYTGKTYVDGGVYCIGPATGTAYGSLGKDDTSATTIAKDATLVIQVPGARTFSGAFSGEGLLYIDTVGTYTFSATSTFTGSASVTGTVVLSATNALGVGPGTISGGTLQLKGNVSIAKPLRLGGTLENLSEDNTWAGPVTITVTGPTIQATGGTLRLTSTELIKKLSTLSSYTVGLRGTGTVVVTSPFESMVSGSLTVWTGCTTRLEGLSTGIVNVSLAGGTLEVKSLTDGTSASSLGTDGTLRVTQDSTFRYVGAADGVLLRTLAFSDTRALTLENTGAGTIKVSSTSHTSSTGNTLVLTGTNTGRNEVSAILRPAVPSVTKNGDGRWVLSADNTYTGPTTINKGTLAARSPTTAARFGLNNTVTVNGGTLQTLTDDGQMGRHTYTHLTLTSGKLRIGG